MPVSTKRWRMYPQSCRAAESVKEALTAQVCHNGSRVCVKQLCGPRTGHLCQNGSHEESRIFHLQKCTGDAVRKYPCAIDLQLIPRSRRRPWHTLCQSSPTVHRPPTIQPPLKLRAATDTHRKEKQPWQQAKRSSE